ncbi:MAG: DUF1073 domain-containing protein [Methylophaga sp.]|nr:DUF1073 domain-containing protein [Methylophaga sp.]MAX53499.1 DUF1073 domain-containing protein [Methylophaga sp.]|tara:strand:+ start:11087 stop:12490 length:1404 start_codon:yes stop_codon:yes gene_type:complete
MAQQDKETRLTMAVNQYMSERRLASMRQALAYGAGYNASSDTKRPKSWENYGFPNTLNFYDFLNLYQRNSLAKAGVNRLIRKTWQDNPWIIQGDTTDEKTTEKPWERDVRKLFKRLNVWQKFQDADRRRMVGAYSGLILRVADNARWDEELQPGGDLIEIIPAWEGQLTPGTWDENPNSPRYGQPTTWNYNEGNVQTADTPPPARSVTIHHSRVVIVGDYREGVSELEAAYNDFVSVVKITGGSGEGFLKNASRQLSVEYSDSQSLPELARSYGVGMDELNERLNEMMADLNSVIDAAAFTTGGKINPLVANVPQPKEHFEIQVQCIAASLEIPTKVLIGNQQGERASTEDQDDFNNRCQARRGGDLQTDIRRFIDRLMEYRIIPPVPGDEYEVMWSELNDASLADKLAMLKTATEAVKNMAGTGEIIATGDELRAIIGWEALTEPEVPADDLGDDNGEYDERMAAD